MSKSTRKSYVTLSPVQKSLTEDATVVLSDGSVANNVIRLSANGRFWVGVADGKPRKFNVEDVLEHSGGSPDATPADATPEPETTAAFSMPKRGKSGRFSKKS